MYILFLKVVIPTHGMTQVNIWQLNQIKTQERCIRNWELKQGLKEI